MIIIRTKRIFSPIFSIPVELFEDVKALLPSRDIVRAYSYKCRLLISVVLNQFKASQPLCYCSEDWRYVYLTFHLLLRDDLSGLIFSESTT
jgi:hypothetical protein